MSNKTNIESLTLTINSNVCEMFTHKVVRKDALGFEVYVELYRAQDMLLVSGLSNWEQKDRLSDWKKSLEINNSQDGKIPTISNDSIITLKTGPLASRGLYLTKRTLFKLAAYIDSGFYDAVFDAFEALTEGRYNEAAGIAARVAISPELKVELKESNRLLNEAIIEWDTKRPEGRAKGHLFTMYHDHIVCQVVTGGSLKSLKASSSCNSLSDMMLKGDQIEHVQALLAMNELLTKLLWTGLDYYTIRDILKR